MKLHFTFAVMLTGTTLECGLMITICNLRIANRHTKSEWMVRFQADWSLWHLHMYRSCIFGSSYMDMLTAVLEPQLRDDGILLWLSFNTMGQHFILKKYCAWIPHLNLSRWIDRALSRLWSLCSPDVMPVEFCGLCFIKYGVYKTEINNNH